MFRRQWPARGRTVDGIAGGRTAMTEGRARLIRIEVHEGKEKLLISTSPDLPKFEVVGLSYAELAEEIPATIRDRYKLQHDQDVEVTPVHGGTLPYPTEYEVRMIARELEPA